MPQIGIATSLANDSVVAAAGYTCLIESISSRISPRTVPDSTFEHNLLLFKQLRTPICAVNLFLPADLKVVGPNVDETAVLAYAEQVLARVERAGIPMVVWGSGGSRHIPDGFSRAEAERQFVHLARQIADVAQRHHVLLVVENLNSGETNFLNTVAETLRILQQVNHPYLRLNADLYHMQKEGESPDILLKTGDFLRHVEVAESPNRTPPGVEGADFRPYLRVLRQVNYHQKIVLECGWKDLGTQARPALLYLSRQLEEAYR